MNLWPLKLFKRKPIQKSIQKFTPSVEKDNFNKNLRIKILALDQRIEEISQGLIQAQTVSLKALIINNKNWLGNIQNKFYGNAAQESAEWHRNQLIMLYKEKRSLQNILDNSTSQFFPGFIRRWAKFIAYSICIVFAILLIILGTITAIYLLPLLITFILVYFAIQSKNIHRY